MSHTLSPGHCPCLPREAAELGRQGVATALHLRKKFPPPLSPLPHLAPSAGRRETPGVARAPHWRCIRGARTRCLSALSVPVPENGSPLEEEVEVGLAVSSSGTGVVVGGREEQRKGEEEARRVNAENEIVMIKSEMWIEQRVFNSRFQTLTAVVGSLVGATLCFIRGSMLVAESVGYASRHLMSHTCTRVILYLLEALDVYLMGTVMLIFGMGLYELFITPLEVAPEGGDAHPRSATPRSSLFGLFPLTQKPKWLEINSLDELKSKLGHIMVTIMVVAMFEKSKKVAVTTAQDFFLFAASTAMAAGCMVFLSKLSGGFEE